jgi:hypothetical protein
MVPVLGNVTALLLVNVGETKTWTAATANTTVEQTVTVLGLRLATDKAGYASKPTHQAGLGVVGCRVSADDTLAITFMNNTGSDITPTANEGYHVTICRRENKITDAVA